MDPIAFNLQQKNLIFHHIVGYKLEPADFTWQDGPGKLVPQVTGTQLTHLPTGYYFRLDYASNYVTPYLASYSPGRHGLHEQVRARGISDLVEAALAWVVMVSRDCQTEDLWAEAAKQKQLIKTAGEQDIANTRFTNEETKLLAARIDDLARKVEADSSINQENQRRIIGHLEYLKESSERLGKKDWLMVTLAIIPLIQAFALAPEATMTLLQGIASLLGYVRMLP